MTLFIEVTRLQGEEPQLINPASIERVQPEGTGSLIIFRGGNGAGEAERVRVKDAYADLRKLLVGGPDR